MIPYKASDDDNEALKPSRKFPCKKRETIFCEQTYKAKCLENYELLKNNLETIINDIREVKQQKEAFLKKAVFKNQTNTYKILMMTFAKTFDYLRKGTQFRCLALSLY